MTIRVVIIDDNGQFLAAARDLLERQGIEVVAVATNGTEGRRLVADVGPDCVLVDVDLGVESGFDIAEQLFADENARVVLISAYSETEFADLITASPALGFIAKTRLSGETIMEMLDGEGATT